ncbi:MAG: Coenzyme F420 hydrogenase/dehydrogenase, beta subunit C-terminal domain [Faecousia sp.]
MMNISPIDCCGCGGCIAVCPKACISMSHSLEGFITAVVDEEKCIHCGLCLTKCSQRFQYNENKKPKLSYLAFSTDDTERGKASSGGIFSELAKQIIEQDGLVYGAAFDNDFVLKHKCATSKEELNALIGSKYLQSEVFPVFSEIKRYVQNKKVLFVGTPCQVYALKQTVGDSDNLFTADLICHGVPSPKLFEGYRKYLEKKMGGSILSYCFRSKEQANALMSYTVKATYQKKNGEIDTFYLNGDDEPYTMRFISNSLQCKACYKCPFANLDRQGDITLGDYWGYDKVHPDYSHIQGVSLVLVNTPNGHELINSINNIHLADTQDELYLPYNGHLQRPPVASPDRDGIYSAFLRMGFSKRFYIRYFLPRGYKMYIFKRKVRRVLKRIRTKG